MRPSEAEHGRRARGAQDDEEEQAEELAEGALDPDEVDPLLDPYDEGSDDEL